MSDVSRSKQLNNPLVVQVNIECEAIKMGVEKIAEFDKNFHDKVNSFVEFSKFKQYKCLSWQPNMIKVLFGVC